MRFLKMKRVWIPLLVIILLLLFFSFFRKGDESEDLPTSHVPASRMLVGQSPT